MRRSLPWVVCVALLAGVLASGCGTTTDENASLAATKLHGSKARIKIYRTQELASSGVAASVKVDGRQIASLGVGGSTLLDVSAGSHKISIEGGMHPNAYAITLQAKPGMLYALEISPRSEAVVAGMFGLVGMMVEASVNENGGPFQVRVAEANPLNR